MNELYIILKIYIKSIHYSYFFFKMIPNHKIKLVNSQHWPTLILDIEIVT